VNVLNFKFPSKIDELFNYLPIVAL